MGCAKPITYSAETTSNQYYVTESRINLFIVNSAVHYLTALKSGALGDNDR